MASRFSELLTRSFVPKAGLGNLLIGPRTSGSKSGPTVATKNVNWQSPGQPQILDMDAQAFGEDSYLNQVYVMRCVQLIANTIAGLEFRAGMDPTNPATHDPTAPLVQLLGRSTPQAPGGPNPDTASRAFWAWTICQYIVYGKFAWEAQLTGKQIVGLWPLVSACVSAVPSNGGQRYFDSYVYTTPMDGDLPMKADRMIYAWRPSLTDWRVPETVLSAAKLPIYIAKGMDRYMVKLLENDMVATTIVTTPPFEEASARRAWQEQFNTMFSGVDAKGRTIFAEADYDEDDTSGKPLIQVEKIAQTAVEAELLTISNQAKTDITIALGVSISLIGDASRRIYANADSEYRNFWTLTIMNLLTELQDHVNQRLAPRIGPEVGWFDLSKVVSLQPPSIFQPPMIGDVINFGVATAAQVANVLGIPAANSTGEEDTDTVEIGEESSATGAGGMSGGGGGRSASWRGTRVTKDQLLAARIRWEQRPLNSFNWEDRFHASDWLEREHIDVYPRSVIEARSTEVTHRSRENQEALAILRKVNRAKERHDMAQLENRRQRSAELVERTTQMAQDYRALATADRTTKHVHDTLAQNYPESTLDWVDDADWSGPQQVPLDQIDMARRPGARDPKKVAGIAQGIAKGDTGALAPVMLVKTPGSDKLKVADGYHRTKAHEKLGHTTVSAYMGSVDEDEGPWDADMHDAKLNRMLNSMEVRRGGLKVAQNCKYGSHPATKAIVWAEGAAYVPVCADHYNQAVTKIGGPTEVDKVVDLPQAERQDTGQIHGPDRENVVWVGLDGKLQDSLDEADEEKMQQHLASQGAVREDDDLTEAELEVVAKLLHDDVDVMPYSGTDFDRWFEQNSPALLKIAEATS